MAIKDILVHVDASEAAGHRLSLAADLAHANGAHLTGLHVKPSLYFPAIEDYSALPPSYIEDMRREADEAAAKAKTAFEDAARAADVESEWRVEQAIAPTRVASPTSGASSSRRIRLGRPSSPSTACPASRRPTFR